MDRPSSVGSHSNAAFGRFWLARVVSFAGDQIARTALLIAVFDRQGGAALGMLLLAGTLPRLLGPFLGVLADRIDQRRLMVGCDLGQAALYLTLAVAAPSLPVLLALVTAATTLATVFTPAGRSLLPGLVGREGVPAANARLAVGINIGVAAGPALGGLLLAGVGLAATVLVDAATFVLSAALLAGVRRVEPAGDRPAEPYRRVLRTGLALVRRTPVVWAVSVGYVAVVAFAALDNVALVPLGRIELHTSEVAIGLLGTAYGLGMVLAPLVLARGHPRLPPERILVAGLAALAVGTLATGVSPIVAAALLGQAVAGAGAAWHHVASDTLIQQHVPAERLGTVFGTVYMFPYAAEGIAYLVGAPLLTLVGARWLFVISALGVLASVAVVARMVSVATPVSDAVARRS
jgi:predicted MFS family arabinose efflux permease